MLAASGTPVCSFGPLTEALALRHNQPLLRFDSDLINRDQAPVLVEEWVRKKMTAGNNSGKGYPDGPFCRRSRVERTAEPSPRRSMGFISRSHAPASRAMTLLSRSE